MTTPTTPNRKLAITGAMVAAVLAIAGAIEHKWEPGRDPNLGYWDAAGKVATACEGHTGGVVVGHRYTDAQCAEWKRADNMQAIAVVNRCIHVRLSNGQAGALVEGVYNLSPALVCGSTLQTMVNAGIPASRWCLQLRHWVYGGGYKMRGLVDRREDDLRACLQ